MESLYLTCLFVSLGMLFWLKLFDVKSSIPQFVSLLILAFSNLGFFFFSISTNISEAMIAYKMIYVGGCFMPFFYFLLVLEICHIEINRILSTILLLCQCVVYGFVCTIGTNTLFYKSATLSFVGGEAFMEKVYGPLHFLYPLTMYSYVIASIAVIIYSLKKERTINKKSVIIMIMLCVMGSGIYIVERVAHFRFDVFPIVLIVLMIGALIPIYQHSIFAVYETNDIINEQMGKVGFISFDKKLIYQDSNEFMTKVFPELYKYSIGKRIEECSEELKVLIDQIDPNGFEKDKKSKKYLHIPIKSFWLNEKYYKGVVHAVTNSFGVLKGYAIEITDNTADRMVIELKESYNEELSKEVEEKTRRIRLIQQKTILGMARMVESRDLSTGGHIMRTSDVVRIFAKKLVESSYDVDEYFMNLVIRSAPMHDLGKIGVDDAVLRKQGKFTDEEYAKMKEHSEIGYHMVSEILADVEDPDFVRVAENVAHYHHEKVNGTGYPHGLKGEEIPVEARIMALADVFDALVSKRCYKDAFSCEEAFKIIEKDSGSHFDAELGKIFISCREELEEYYKKSME